MRFLRLAVAAVFCATLAAQESAPERLKVGVFDHPPFAQKDDSGEWTGLAIDLWERVASQIGRPFDYVEIPLEDAISETAAGRMDVIAAALGVSAERERRLDFTQPFITTSAAAAVSRKARLPHWFDFLRDLLGHGVLSILAILTGSLLLFSFVFWLAERRSNHAHFGGKATHGFGSALWFAAVTMTTVGYGDKTPHSVAGRTLAFLWMFFGIFIVGIFTATLASSIAISRTQTSITRPSDLAAYRSGVLEGSIAERVFAGSGLRAQTYPTVEAGLAALHAGEITAFVDLEISLRFVINRDFPGEILVESLPSEHVSMAFAVRPGMDLLDAINVALIEQTTAAPWSQEIDRWAGPPVR